MRDDTPVWWPSLPIGLAGGGVAVLLLWGGLVVGRQLEDETPGRSADRGFIAETTTTTAAVWDRSGWPPVTITTLPGELTEAPPPSLPPGLRPATSAGAAATPVSPAERSGAGPAPTSAPEPSRGSASPTAPAERVTSTTADEPPVVTTTTEPPTTTTSEPPTTTTSVETTTTLVDVEPPTSLTNPTIPVDLPPGKAVGLRS